MPACQTSSGEGGGAVSFSLAWSSGTCHNYQRSLQGTKLSTAAAFLCCITRLSNKNTKLQVLPVAISTSGFDCAPFLSSGHWVIRDPVTEDFNFGAYRGRFNMDRQRVHSTRSGSFQPARRTWPSILPDRCRSG